MSLLIRFRKIIKWVLEKKGLRTLGGIVATINAKGGESGIKRIYCKDDLWIHQYENGYIVERSINSKYSISKFEADTKDLWEFLYHPATGDIILDVGAGIGSEVSLFSKQVGPSGMVIAIEAHPETYRCLKLFCELNNLTNVRAYNYAVADKPGTVTIDDDSQHISSSIMTENSKIEVKSTSLDILLNEIGINKVNYLKMNIEGAERLAIKGMANSVDKIDYACISCHDFKSDRGEGEFFRTREEIKTFLEHNGSVIKSRLEDARPWVRDQLNATRIIE